MNDSLGRLNRDELFELYKYYGAAIQAELDFYFKYFNFYVGLLSAILTLTFAGLTGLEKPAGQLIFLSLLMGPVLIIFLSIVGYSYVQVFYIRFTEAWVATVNIEEMLQLHDTDMIDTAVRQPLYLSKERSFIPEITSRKIRGIFQQAKAESWFAEELVEKLIKEGVTRRRAIYTFSLFIFAGITLAIIILYTYLGY